MTNEQPIPQEGRPAHRPVAALVTQVLLLLNAAFWVALGVVSLGRTTGGAGSGWVLGLLMFGNAAVLVAIGWGLGTRYRRWVYYLALPILLITMVLSVTDEFGLLDLLSLLFAAAPLVLLLVRRSWYVNKETL